MFKHLRLKLLMLEIEVMLLYYIHGIYFWGSVSRELVSHKILLTHHPRFQVWASNSQIAAMHNVVCIHYSSFVFPSLQDLEVQVVGLIKIIIDPESIMAESTAVGRKVYVRMYMLCVYLFCNLEKCYTV